MKKKLTALIMTVVMAVAIVPLNVSEVHAYDVGFTGRDCTTSSVAASTIDYITAKYKLYSTWKGSGQCWGYAEKINSLLGASTYTISCKRKWNKTNIKELLLCTKAGAHVRIENEERGFYHSIVILKCTKDEVIWTDGNFDYNNGIRYTRQSFDSFVSFRNDGSTYITQVKKVKNYKYHKEPLLATQLKGTKVGLYWTKVKDATSYKVYRAASENGTYKRIATTTYRNYVDSSAPIGKKMYYKVVAVKSSGNVKSNIASGTRKLPNPTGVKASNSKISGKIMLSWNKVAGASSYKIYRYNPSKNAYVIVKTTTNLSYLDSNSAKVGQGYYYKIKAYSGTTKSYSSGVCIDGIVRPARPVNVTVAQTSETNVNPTITWSKVTGATEYIVLRAYSPTGTFSTVGYVKASEGCSFEDRGVQQDLLNNGEAYYKVRAYYNGWLSGADSKTVHYLYTPPAVVK